MSPTTSSLVPAAPPSQEPSAPVFFALSRRRWAIFAAFSLVLMVSLATLVGLSAASLLSDDLKVRLGMTPKAPVSLDLPASPQDSHRHIAPEKAVALVFGRAPNERESPKIIEILAREHVPATFFLRGQEAASASQLVEHLFAGGHELGNRTALASDPGLNLGETSTNRVIEAVTGHSTRLHLNLLEGVPPGPVPLAAIATIDGHGTVVLGSGPTPLVAATSATGNNDLHRIERKDSYVVMVNDGSRDTAQVAEALPRVIGELRHRGFRFTTVSGLLGKQRDDVMPRLTSSLDLALARVNRLVLSLSRNGGEVLEWIFSIGALLAMIRTVVVVAMASLQHRQQKRLHAAAALSAPSLSTPAPPASGLVSILVPAYNEILNVASVIEHALSSAYQDIEVIFIDDGSTDGSYQHLASKFGTDPRVHLLRKANGGKASALNAGLRVARGRFVVCIDGDTLMTPTTIHHLLAEFTSDQVAAVAGCVRVANARNLLTRWQEVEYMIGQNLDRQALGLVNGINTIPGAIGMFRRKAILEVGGYASDTLAEDTDLTMRLHARGYHVAFAPKAMALTEAPETTTMLMRQRFRWSFGAMQTLWKHRDLFGSSVCPGLGWFTMPQVLIFQLLLPFLVPLADAFLILSLWAAPSWHVVTYGLIFLGVDLAAATLALVLAGERLRLPYLTLMLLSQRVGYRYFVFIPLLRALLAAIRGHAVGWGHLQRLGRVAYLGAVAPSTPPPRGGRP